MGVIIKRPPEIYTEGEGIDISGANVISGEDATTSNKGIASFYSGDFLVSSGAVELKSKASYWSCAGSAFSSTLPSIQSVAISLGRFQALQDSVAAIVFVNLPHGAVIVNCSVDGNAAASAETWYLRRIHKETAAVDTLANHNINSTDSTISYSVANNGTYGYYIETSSLDTNDEIWAAEIAYTL